MIRTVYLDRIVSNAKLILENTPASLCAVVKCNAYGHGLSRVCKALKDVAHCFAVSSVFEAKQLRKIDSSVSILNLGTFKHSQISYLQQFNTIQSVHNLYDLQALMQYCCQNKLTVQVDIKINSGFNRLGLNFEECLKAVLMLENCPNLSLHGLYTHFCDYTSQHYCNFQYEIFKKCADLFAKYNPTLHCLSSKGQHFETHFHHDMVRCGLSLYGIGEGLQQIMHLSSHIVQINFVPKGQRVGYNNYTVFKDSVVATVQGGYGQGLLRNAYNRVFVCNVLCPIVGDICMDFFMVDVSAVAKQYPSLNLVGQAVTISDDRLPLDVIAKECNTIPYQLMVATNVKHSKTIYK